jgi:rod shape-determining protein MreD
VSRAAAAAAVVAAALLQVTIASRFEVGGVLPNLVLVAVVVIAWTLGPRTGLVLACAGGLLLDLGTAGPVGPHALALLGGPYLIGWLSRRVQPPSAVVVAVTAAPATLLYSVVLFGLQVPPIEMLAAATYNTVLVLFAFVLVRSLSLGRISRRAQA